MSIIYYPNRVYKGQVPAIDRVLAKREPISNSGSKNIAASPLDVTIYSDDNWMIDSISFNFASAVARDFSAYIANGRAVVENLNDYLWFDVIGAGRNKVTLTAGFYTGTELAAQLKTQLDASYATAGITFAVTYTAATGLFRITPSSSTMAYIDKNCQQDFMGRDSIAGHLFGLTRTTGHVVDVSLPCDAPTYASPITTDTAVFGLDNETAIINQAASVVLSYYHNTLHVLTMDQALRLSSNDHIVQTIDYNVIYETVV